MSKNQTGAPAAQSNEAVIARMVALEPTIRELLAGVNAILDSRPDPVPSHEDGGCHPIDRTENRLRAYVASMRGIRGVGTYRDDIDEAQQRGRALIERLALTAEDDRPPRLMLTAEQVADVLAFIQSREPVEIETWWRDDVDDEPSHVVGFYILLQALQNSLRHRAQGNAPADIAARVAACKAKAQALMADLDGLVAELPEWRDGAKGMDGALMAVREELQAAAGQVDGVLDYLTPRGDDDPDPACCAHRRLQALIAADEAQPA